MSRFNSEQLAFARSKTNYMGRSDAIEFFVNP